MMYYYKRKRLWTCERCKGKFEYLGYNSGLYVCGKCDHEMEAEKRTREEESVF